MLGLSESCAENWKRREPWKGVRTAGVDLLPKSREVINGKAPGEEKR